MSENATVPTPESTVEEQERTFTQSELDAIVRDRLAREKGKYADYEEIKAKAIKFDEAEEANKTELQKATEKVAELESQLASIQKAKEIADMKSKVSQETGIPTSLLTGTTEEECIAQAEAIKAYANPGYPTVKDGGEVQKVQSADTRTQFADWANQAFN